MSTDETADYEQEEAAKWQAVKQEAEAVRRTIKWEEPQWDNEQAGNFLRAGDPSWPEIWRRAVALENTSGRPPMDPEGQQADELAAVVKVAHTCGWLMLLQLLGVEVADLPEAFDLEDGDGYVAATLWPLLAEALVRKADKVGDGDE